MQHFWDVVGACGSFKGAMGGSQAPGLDRTGQGLTSLAQVKGRAAGEEGRRKLVGYG